MKLLLKLLGAGLVLAACTGGGALLWLDKRKAWRQVRAFAALVEYLGAGIRFTAVPCAPLLEQAAADERFAALGWGQSAKQCFADVPVPTALGAPLAEQARQTLRELGDVPHRRACALLDRLLQQCRAAEQQALQTAQEAGHLYPRLGACAGLLLVLVLL